MYIEGRLYFVIFRFICMRIHVRYTIFMKSYMIKADANKFIYRYICIRRIPEKPSNHRKYYKNST